VSLTRSGSRIERIGEEPTNVARSFKPRSPSHPALRPTAGAIAAVPYKPAFLNVLNCEYGAGMLTHPVEASCPRALIRGLASLPFGRLIAPFASRSCSAPHSLSSSPAFCLSPAGGSPWSEPRFSSSGGPGRVDPRRRSRVARRALHATSLGLRPHATLQTGSRPTYFFKFGPIEGRPQARDWHETGLAQPPVCDIAEG
jgi:hypothetical protein